MAVGSDDTLTVWLNGKQVYDFDRTAAASSPRPTGSTSSSKKGTNRLLIQCGNRGGPWAVLGRGDRARPTTPS